MGVVELAHAFGARFLQLLQRRPFEQEVTAQWGKEILTGQLQGLRIITLAFSRGEPTTGFEPVTC